MKLNKKIIIFSIVTLIVSIYVVSPVMAATVCPEEDKDGALPNPFNACNFEQVVTRLAEWLYIVMVPLASLMILYAAFLFMTSAGNEERVTLAKKTLLWTLVGVAIIVIGSGFVNLIKDLLSKK